MDIERNLTTDTVAQAWPAKPLCVTTGTTVRAVMAILQEQKRGSILVCRDERLVGIFTERDVLRLLARRGNLDAPIDDVMVTNPTTIGADATVADAIQLMSAGGYRSLPIVDSQHRPVGVVKVKGIVHYLVEHFPKSIYNLPPVAHPIMQHREGS